MYIHTYAQGTYKLKALSGQKFPAHTVICKSYTFLTVFSIATFTIKTETSHNRYVCQPDATHTPSLQLGVTMKNIIAVGNIRK